MRTLIGYAALWLLMLSSCGQEVSEIATSLDTETSQAQAPLLQVAIDTHGKSILDEPKIAAAMQITDESGVVYDGDIGIEYRGSTSQAFFDKKSYGFETWDGNGEQIDVALAGFPEEGDWIFYGPFSDKTLLRNVLIFALSNEMGRYATKTGFCELTLNGSYEGIYVLMEKMKRGVHRVDISELGSDDITGGYILKIDKTVGDGTGGRANYTDAISFSSQYDASGNPDGEIKPHFLYEYPDAEDIERDEKAYIQQYIHDFESALNGPDFRDPTSGYPQYIDIDSFVDFFLLNEISNNPDAYRLSTYLHKDKGEKLQLGPIWDFNLAFGNADYCNGWETDHWAYEIANYCPTRDWPVPFWWERFMEDPDFVNTLKARWTTLRQGMFSLAFIDSILETHQARLMGTGALTRNEERWQVMGAYIWPNYYVGQTYEEEYAYLRQWIVDRLTWLDDAIDGL